ncbi:hypothetical protein DPMN_115837 [Dreissena polymorpha]|uniref:Gustatory receptor n=1 Tax=Dreissena polymorpha TaxID=45954 RepID=A0A9D4QU51_DREPO|nr:hypothetical protein DPMN_115837 [Dreissena polymorpha]
MNAKPEVSEARGDDHRQIFTLQKLIRPVLVGLALCGCYNFGDIVHIDHGHKNNFKTVISATFRFVCLLIMLVVCVKYGVTLYYVSYEYKLFAVMCFIFNLNLVARFVACLKMTHRSYGNQEKCFKTWEEDIFPECLALKLRCPVSTINARTKWAVIVASGITVINVAFVEVQVEMYPELASLHLFPLPNTILIKVALILLMLMCSAVYMFPQTYIFALNTTLTSLFKNLTEKLEQDICKNETKFPPNFQRLRLLHLKLSKLVAELDKDMGWFYAANIGFGTGLGVFILYHIMKTTMDTFFLIMCVFWLLTALAEIGFAATCAAFLHDAVSIMR